MTVKGDKGKMIWAMGALVGLMDISGHATPTKQLRWLSSVIVMCKIAFDLTGVICSSLFKEYYKKLTNKEKFQLNNRGFSTFHAIVAAAGSLYLVVFSGLFADPEDGLIINKSSNLSNTVMGRFQSGTFYLTCLIIYHYPALGGIEYAKPREEVLAEKGLDWKKMDSEIEVKKLGSRPTSSQSNRPGSQESSLSVTHVASEKPKVNPFGNAKPREVLLEEKGLDWKKIDLDLEQRRVERGFAGAVSVDGDRRVATCDARLRRVSHNDNQ
ncbi:hypothetical protein CASFOL_028405 [Castilleja foliolosa]|uniref:Uncharacterized protein n=1 Tax=Castilleja foliolosa TaxID=1961234 RepID=A0ABD3CBX9_9LAMI